MFSEFAIQLFEALMIGLGLGRGKLEPHSPKCGTRLILGKRIKINQTRPDTPANLGTGMI
jgi:hypothetical protein